MIYHCPMVLALYIMVILSDLVLVSTIMYTHLSVQMCMHVQPETDINIVIIIIVLIHTSEVQPVKEYIETQTGLLLALNISV